MTTSSRVSASFRGHANRILPSATLPILPGPNSFHLKLQQTKPFWISVLSPCCGRGNSPFPNSSTAGSPCPPQCFLAYSGAQASPTRRRRVFCAAYGGPRRSMYAPRHDTNGEEAMPNASSRGLSLSRSPQAMPLRIPSLPRYFGLSPSRCGRL
ncbi:hypothetical protein LY76DRAFT_596898 [Colletotrichum caudatum]|nr:hypothetical protein LY76DRAFT_596898 [Colletotrichum caudatum]